MEALKAGGKFSAVAPFVRAAALRFVGRRCGFGVCPL